MFKSFDNFSKHRAEKSSLVSGNRPGEKFLITYPPESNVDENIYFLFQKNTHTNKKISTSKFNRTNLCFFPSLVFQPRKVLLEYLLKCKLHLKKSIKLIIFFFYGHPGEDFFRHPHFRKQEYYFFWTSLNICAYSSEMERHFIVFAFFYHHDLVTLCVCLIFIAHDSNIFLSTSFTP